MLSKATLGNFKGKMGGKTLKVFQGSLRMRMSRTQKKGTNRLDFKCGEFGPAQGGWGASIVEMTEKKGRPIL